MKVAPPGGQSLGFGPDFGIGTLLHEPRLGVAQKGVSTKQLETP